MAKKKEKEKEKKKVEKTKKVEKIDWPEAHNLLCDEIKKQGNQIKNNADAMLIITRRIDRIVAALDKSKSVRGL